MTAVAVISFHHRVEFNHLFERLVRVACPVEHRESAYSYGGVYLTNNLNQLFGQGSFLLQPFMKSPGPVLVQGEAVSAFV